MQEHLVVFIHGFEGTGHDFDNVEKIFLLKMQKEVEPIRTFKSFANSSFGGTYDGIENGAIRIWKELMPILNSSSSSIHSISIIGHSLGGLYARFLLRLLDDCFVFDRIIPKYFITLASPHLSVRRPQTGLFSVAFQHVAQRVCTTTRELCLEDSSVSPILYRMTEESFVKVLRKFSHRIVYANVYNDFQVFYSTASISVKNPYRNDPSKVIRSLKYGDLTEFCITTVQERLQHDIQDLDDFAKNDTQGRLLRAMFLRLNELTWERYDCLFSTVLAHEQIIHKRSLFAGKFVIHHLTDIMYLRNKNMEEETTTVVLSSI